MVSQQGAFLEVTDNSCKRQEDLKLTICLLFLIDDEVFFFNNLLLNHINYLYVSGAFQLLQLQDDICRQYKMDGSGPENDVESHIRSNKDTFLNSLWKLNVVDIELTLINVCQMVSSLLFPSF